MHMIVKYYKLQLILKLQKKTINYYIIMNIKINFSEG